jgi:hypothetical protein
MTPEEWGELLTFGEVTIHKGPTPGPTVGVLDAIRRAYAAPLHPKPRLGLDWASPPGDILDDLERAFAPRPYRPAPVWLGRGDQAALDILKPGWRDLVRWDLPRGVCSVTGLAFGA